MKNKIIGALAVLRQKQVGARTLATMDARSFTRTCFLSSIADLGVHKLLPASRDDIATALGITEPDRLNAWLNLGVALKELEDRNGQLSAKGRRLKAMTKNDRPLIHHYQSFPHFQAPTFANLGPLLRHETNQSLYYPSTNSYAAINAESAILPTVRTAALEAPLARFLDIGCRTGTFTNGILASRATMTGIAIDSNPDLVAGTKQRLNQQGWGGRVKTQVSDVFDVHPEKTGTFGLITLIDQVILVPATRRLELFNHVASLLEPGGFVVVVSTTTGSVASAHLDFMLRCQGSKTSLPTISQLLADLAKADLGVSHNDQLLPGEQLWAITAHRSWF